MTHALKSLSRSTLGVAISLAVVLAIWAGGLRILDVSSFIGKGPLDVFGYLALDEDAAAHRAAVTENLGFGITAGTAYEHPYPFSRRLGTLVGDAARVLVVDDILATGGTLEASAKLLHRAGLHIAGFGLLMELTDQRGRGKLGGHRTRALYRV